MTAAATKTTTVWLAAAAMGLTATKSATVWLTAAETTTMWLTATKTTTMWLLAAAKPAAVRLAAHMLRLRMLLWLCMLLWCLAPKCVVLNTVVGHIRLAGLKTARAMRCHVITGHPGTGPGHSRRGRVTMVSGKMLLRVTCCNLLVR